MLIHRLTAAQGCLLSSDINTGETPRRQVFYFFNLMVGGGWAYYFLYFSDYGHASGDTTNLSWDWSYSMFYGFHSSETLGKTEGTGGLVGASHCLIEWVIFGVLLVLYKILQRTRDQNGARIVLNACVLGCLYQYLCTCSASGWLPTLKGRIYVLCLVGIKAAVSLRVTQQDSAPHSTSGSKSKIFGN